MCGHIKECPHLQALLQAMWQMGLWNIIHRMQIYCIILRDCLHWIWLCM